MEPNAVDAGVVAPLPTLPKDKLLAYSEGKSFEQFATGAERYAALLRSRYAESRLPPDLQFAANMFPETINILALVTEEDPDTIAVLPAVARLVTGSPRLQLRILRDDDDLTPLIMLAPTLDLATLLDEWDLPQFLLFDEDWELQAQWGPRPAAAEGPLERWLSDHPTHASLAEDESPEAQAQYAELAQELVYSMRVWYNSGLTKACYAEWHDLLRAWQSGDEVLGLDGDTP